MYLEGVEQKGTLLRKQTQARQKPKGHFWRAWALMNYRQYFVSSSLITGSYHGQECKLKYLQCQTLLGLLVSTCEVLEEIQQDPYFRGVCWPSIAY